MIVDIFLVYSFIKRLATPFNEWDAFKLGIIDEKGTILKSRKSLNTVKEQDAFGIYDLMILKLKKLLEKIPGGNTRIGSYAAALWLIKEEQNIMKYGEELSEETIEEELASYMSLVEEGVPTNSAGGGAIAGIGVGPDGEPGFSKAQMVKYKKKNRPLKRFSDYKEIQK